MSKWPSEKKKNELRNLSSSMSSLGPKEHLKAHHNVLDVRHGGGKHGSDVCVVLHHGHYITLLGPLCWLLL